MHTVENLGGRHSSIFSKIPGVGVNAFLVKSQGDKSFWVLLFIHFYEQVFKKFAWVGPISSHYPQSMKCIYERGS